MFWFVFIFPGKPGCLLPRETPPSRAAVLGMPACRRSAESRECGRRRRPLSAPAAEVAPLPAAVSTQGWGSAA